MVAGSPSLLLLLLLVLLVSASAGQSEPFAFRISCGARENIHTQPSNTLWHKDFGYTGGRIANASITSAIVPPLKTLRYFPLSDGTENCYNINHLRRGHYQVRFFFAILADSKVENEPLFDISIMGTQIYSMRSGWSNIDEQAFVEAIVFVRGSFISSCFHSTGHGEPAILSIEYLQIHDKAYNLPPPGAQETILRVAKRLTCGSGRPAFDADYNGNSWGGDRYWAPIKTFGRNSDKAISTEDKIALAGVAPNFYPEQLYQSAIISTDSEPDIDIEIEVDPNKKYSIWLHFAEIYPSIKSSGGRVFDILVNGDLTFKDVDILHMSGKSNAALVLNKTIDVTGKILTVMLRPKNGSHAIINAIEVLEVVAAESRTTIEEVRALQNMKSALGLPARFAWNGDPCAPQQHPWTGVECQYDDKIHRWVIDGLGLDDQGLKGFLPNNIFKLHRLRRLNLSSNSIHGSIPYSIGIMDRLESLDLSYNMLNGSIPESIGRMKSLRILNLNGNSLSGKVPAELGGRLLHRASFNFTDNAGLCGIPGLPTCGRHLSFANKIGIAIGTLVLLLLIATCIACWLKRRQNIIRAQKISTGREAPYAKARTNFNRDVQMAKHQRARSPEGEPRLIS